MATKQCPPQEELEFKIRGDKVLFNKKLAPAGDIISKWLKDNAYDPEAMALRVTLESEFGPAFDHCEVTDPATRLGLLVGGIQRYTEKFKPMKMMEVGSLNTEEISSRANRHLQNHQYIGTPYEVLGIITNNRNMALMLNDGSLIYNS